MPFVARYALLVMACLADCLFFGAVCSEVALRSHRDFRWQAHCQYMAVPVVLVAVHQHDID
jgi:hypothetical protein